LREQGALFVFAGKPVLHSGLQREPQPWKSDRSAILGSKRLNILYLFYMGRERCPAVGNKVLCTGAKDK
jgi:hypothetical protein